MMFQYYGSKFRLAKYYQEPKFDTICEPFAGSARYSLYGDNWEKQVVLLDPYERVNAIWNYLIHFATEKDIISLPDMHPGDSLNDHEYLSNAERWLIGYYLNPASVGGGVTASNNFTVAWNRKKLNIAEDLYKVKHWKIYDYSYEILTKPNKDITWFIDPPYQYDGGKHYKCSDIDYDHLSNFCKSINGQVIVCEGPNADWLDFERLHESKFIKEYIWYKEE